jgi:hypothetical protein
VQLDGLNVIALGAFEGNIWDGETKATMGIYMDERADDSQARRCRRSSPGTPAAGRAISRR